MISPFSYQGQEIPLKYKTNKRSRRLTLRFSVKDNAFILTLPPRISDSQVSDFLTKCQGWAQNQLKKLDNRKIIGPGENISVHGKVYTCEVDPLRRKPVLCADSQTLFLPSRYTKQDLHHLFKEVALGTLTSYVEKATAALNERFVRVSIRDSKSRWGSCSTTKTISLSWRLILAPREVAQYVCIHEAVHLIHMNHSMAFWREVENLCPDYKQHKKWLKLHGPSLMGI